MPSPGDALSVWALHEVGAQILRDVVGLCGRASIAVLPVKGIVTARLLYGDVAQRPIGDVDIRVRRRDLPALQAAAKAAGWRCVRVLRSYGNLIYDFGALSLDVESSVGPPGLCGLTVDAMLARAEPAEVVAGCRSPVPEVHDHAVLLTVNAFKDKIVTAQPWALSDLERIVVHPAFRREAFVERARDSRIATMAWIVAAWMETARGDRTWGAIRVALESAGSLRRRYARRMRAGLERAARAPMSLRLLARVAADSPFMRVEAIGYAAACAAEMSLHGLASR